MAIRVFDIISLIKTLYDQEEMVSELKELRVELQKKVHIIRVILEDFSEKITSNIELKIILQEIYNTVEECCSFEKKIRVIDLEDEAKRFAQVASILKEYDNLSKELDERISALNIALGINSTDELKEEIEKLREESCTFNESVQKRLEQQQLCHRPFSAMFSAVAQGKNATANMYMSSYPQPEQPLAYQQSSTQSQMAEAPITVQGGVLVMGSNPSAHYHRHEHHHYSTTQPTLSKDSIESLVHKFKEVLREYYLTQGTIKRLFKDNKEPTLIERGYINLCITEQFSYQEEKGYLGGTRKRAETVRDARIQTYEALHNIKRSKPIVPEVLFARQDEAGNGSSKAINRILIRGRAGIGKSTLCRYLVYQWATDQLWQEESFEYVIWVPLRELSAYAAKTKNERKPPSMAEFLRYHAGMSSFFERKNLTEQDISECLAKLSDNTLYILDGYDEITSLLDSHPIWKLIDINSLANKPQWIITSRPCNKLPLKFVDSELEIMGFTDENILAYINSYFEEDPENIKKGAQMFAHLSQNKAVWGVAHIPINLELLCFVWEKEYTGQKVNAQNITMTLLYKKLSDCLLSAYLNDEQRGYPRYLKGKSKHVRGAALPEGVIPVINTIGAIALRGLITQELIIPSQLIHGICKQSQQDIHVIIEVGLLKIIGENAVTENDYYFLHLTFQEYYAALYIVSVFVGETPWYLFDCAEDSCSSKNNNDYHNVETFIQRYKYDERYEIVWWFVSGLLAEQGREITKRFFDLLDKVPVDIIGLRHAILSIRLLEECINQDGRRGLPDLDYNRWLKRAAHYTQKIAWRGKSQTLQGIRPFYVAYQSLIRSLTLSPRVLNDKILSSFIVNEIKQEDTGVIDFCADLSERNISLPMDIITALIAMLQHTYSYIREAAARTLGHQHGLSMDGVSALMAALNDEDRKVRYATADALKEQKGLPVSAIVALKAIQEDRDAYVLDSQRAVLKNPISDFIAKNYKNILEECDTLSKQKSPSADDIFALIEALNREDSDVRYIVADTLGKQEALPTEAFSALIAMLQNNGSSYDAGPVVSILSQQKAMSAEIVLSLNKKSRACLLFHFFNMAPICSDNQGNFIIYQDAEKIEWAEDTQTLEKKLKSLYELRYVCEKPSFFDFFRRAISKSEEHDVSSVPICTIS